MATGIRERYRGAVHSQGLTVDERTSMSDTDVLGAMGIADAALNSGERWAKVKKGEKPHREPITPAPLAVPLERLFAGDHKAVHELVRISAGLLWEQARATETKLDASQSLDIARAVIAWFQHNRCEPCGGRGKQTIPNTPILSAADCEECHGSGKAPFDKHFRYEWKPLARWLKDRIELESGRAGPQAMRTIRGLMDL